LNRVFENDTLAIYNEQLEGMVNISSIKKENISQFILSLTITMRDHRSQETVQVVYESHLFENNLLVLQENINKDRESYTIPAWDSQRRPHLKSTVTPLKNLVLRDNRNLFLI
jgi:hypothetical protein